MSFSIPIGDIHFALEFNDPEVFSFFSRRLQPILPLSKSAKKIIVTNNSKEFNFRIPKEKISYSINKNDVNSLDDVYFIVVALIQYSILEYKILLLHASSIINNKEAYLFMAPSGSGKSTLASKVLDENVLSDDIAVLKKIGSKFYVFTSSFDNKQHNKFPLKKAPLKSIFFIQKASFNRIISQDSAKTINEVLHNNLLFWLLELQKKNKVNYQNNHKIKLYSLVLDLMNFSKAEILYFTKELNFTSLLK